MNNTIKEELNKFKLLMNYNTKITLSENLIKTSFNNTERILISEERNKVFIRNLFNIADNATAAAADDAIKALKKAKSPIYKNAVNLFDEAIVKGAGFSTADELFSAMAKGTLNKTQRGDIAKGLLKKGKVTGSMRTVLTDTASTMALGDPRYMGKSIGKVKKILTGKGYDDAISDEIAMKFGVKNLKAKKIPIGPDDVKKATDNAPKVPKEVTTFEGLKKWGKRAGLAIGAIALIWMLTNDELVTSEEDTIVPTPAPKPGQSRYRNCDNESKYTIGCRTKPDGPIGQVQACLGGLVVDGKFWEKTQAALKAAGYPNGFTINDIPNICNKKPAVEPVVQPEDENISIEPESSVGV